MLTYTPPPDKSITIRALLSAAIADGVTVVSNPLNCDDTEAALNCLAALGVKYRRGRRGITIEGRGLRGLIDPERPLEAGESGALSRMLAGIMAGQDFPSVITGRGSLLKRPMGPLASVLRRLGARVGTASGGRLPLSIRPARLKGARISGLESAQLKSALLYAGLYARGPVLLSESLRSRDHSERMLAYLGASLKKQVAWLRLEPGGLEARPLTVPGDISSAAFFLAGALFLGRPLRVASCGLNPIRLGFVEALRGMGAKIVIKPGTRLPEPTGSLTVFASRLKACRVAGAQVPALIDEVPLLAVTAGRAAGTTVINGIEGLRGKESDRIKSTLALLASLGVPACYRNGALKITGVPAFKPLGPVETFGDHRIAMSAAAASLSCPGLEIGDPDCVNKSSPGFWKDFKKTFGRLPALRRKA